MHVHAMAAGDFTPHGDYGSRRMTAIGRNSGTKGEVMSKAGAPEQALPQ
jgi:hypothetical protein